MVEHDGSKEVGCLVRADPQRYSESSMHCTVVPQLESDFKYGENEELVGHIIKVTYDRDEDLQQVRSNQSIHSSSKLIQTFLMGFWITKWGKYTLHAVCSLCTFLSKTQHPVQIALPHCISRASAVSREAVIKARKGDGKWEELTSTEVTFEGYKVRDNAFNLGCVIIFFSWSHEGMLVSGPQVCTSWTKNIHRFSCSLPVQARLPCNDQERWQIILKCGCKSHILC